jgi:hypothetical protein
MKFQEAKNKAAKLLKSKDFIERVKDEDETMLRHLTILQKINQAGFLTTESQAGKKQTGKSYDDGKKYVISERAFVSGFMVEKKAIEFIKEINLKTDKNAVYVPYCADDVYIPSNLDIPLTITKKNGKEEIITHASTALPKSMWEFFRKQAKINKTEKIVYVFCWDTKWNRDASSKTGLFTDIYKILSSS